MSQRKPIIGLCGGIGAGKSVVAAELAALGCRVIDSDRQGHEALGEPDVVRTIRGWWGDEVVGADGRPDRRRIARIVFSDAVEKGRLELLLYPLIARRRAAIIRAVAVDSAVKAIILDSPLLFESNLDRDCDAVIFVEASEHRRRERLQRTRNWDEREVRRREQWQWPLDQKQARSEFSVHNNGPVEQLRPQLQDILEKVLSRHTAPR